MMNNEALGFALSAVSALAGAMTSLMWSGWWMRGNISDIYLAMREQELKTVQRLSDLKLQIVEVKIQLQTLEGLKR